MSSEQAIRFEPARFEHAEIFLSMMRALEESDPWTTPFDELRRRVDHDRRLMTKWLTGAQA